MVSATSSGCGIYCATAIDIATDVSQLGACHQIETTGPVQPSRSRACRTRRRSRPVPCGARRASLAGEWSRRSGGFGGGRSRWCAGREHGDPWTFQTMACESATTRIKSERDPAAQGRSPSRSRPSRCPGGRAASRRGRRMRWTACPPEARRARARRRRSGESRPIGVVVAGVVLGCRP